MNNGHVGIVVALIAVAALWALPAASQTQPSSSSDWTVPRTADGQPDLQGLWTNNSATPSSDRNSLPTRPSSRMKRWRSSRSG